MSDISDLDDDGPDFASFNDRFVSFLRRWGMAEWLLDSCIGAIYRLHDGSSIDADPPVTLMRKVRFFSEAASRLPPLAPVQPTVELIVDKFRAEKDLRNIIVHGFPLKVEENHTAHFAWTRQTKLGLMYDVRTVRPNDWDRLDRQNAALFAELLVLLHFLKPNPPPTLDQSEEVLREWFVEGVSAFPASKRFRQLLYESLAGRT